MTTDNEIMDIKEAIARAVAYFDMFDFPMTDFEIWQNLEIECGLADMRKALDSLDFLESKNGFYFLPGRSEIIKIRMARYILADRKFKRALKAAKLFLLIPWVKMIALSGIKGAHNLKDEGDIDLFIAAESKRVWITRFFCAGFAKVLGWRPKENDMRDKICLSFYVTEETMNLEKFMLAEETSSPVSASQRLDIDFIYWLAGFNIIYGQEVVMNKFWQANAWLKKYLPNWRPVKVVKRRQALNRRSSLTEDCGGTEGVSRFYKDVIDILIGGLEPQFKKLQLKIMPEWLKEIMNKDTRVVVDDDVLKLHVVDRREKYWDMWDKRVKSIIRDY